jgi:hypothetical protein
MATNGIFLLVFIGLIGLFGWLGTAGPGLPR